MAPMESARQRARSAQLYNAQALAERQARLAQMAEDGYHRGRVLGGQMEQAIEERLEAGLPLRFDDQARERAYVRMLELGFNEPTWEEVDAWLLDNYGDLGFS